MSTELKDNCTADKPRARQFRIEIALDSLDFRSATLDDPVPLGRQILQAASLEPTGTYSLFAILNTGDFEGIRLNESFDLRGRGAERFIVFQSDRTYRFTLNQRELVWGRTDVPGQDLYTLANTGEGIGVFRSVPGGQDELIEPEDTISLSQSGVERFISAPLPVTAFEIVVNSRPRSVESQKVSFEQILKLAFPDSTTANSTYSMTYRNASSTPHANELGVGGVVCVQTTGTIFNVTRTVQS